MASKSPSIRLVTSRDLEVLSALQHSPLTARQLLKLSETMQLPFTDERRVRARMQVLAEQGWAKKHCYATTGRGALSYYKLAKLGLQLLHGEDAAVPSKRFFAPVGMARQHHTMCLADFIVHTTVAAHRAGIRIAGFYPENTIRLAVGEDSLYPDCSFQLVTPLGAAFSFFVELDNSTERIRSEKSVDSWERKIRLYDRLQDTCANRFRVLVVTTRSSERLGHILDAAGGVMRNPERSLIYGIALGSYLNDNDSLRSPCFRDHRGWKMALVPEMRKNKHPGPASRLGRSVSTAHMGSV